MEPRIIDAGMMVSGQIQPGDVPGLAARGVRLIVNNRPDGEEPGQPSGAEIARAAEAAGIAYRHIPVAPGGLTPDRIAAMGEAIEGAQGPVFAFCRSGTRSTFLWALAGAAAGKNGADILRKAADAGYDLTPIAGHLS